ncbi:uncharacterized protein [Coffea arabica]|uniref:Integrase catalytic domain-containing protein n=1 Tax=Coffea arabica TaxID=13443 RepID=A0ABM4U5Z9_COFAR
MGRGAGGTRTAGASMGALARGGRNGLTQARGAPSTGSAVTPQVIRGYCGKFNNSKNDCWRKLGKCLFCGSAEHQVANCPKAPKVGGNTQRPEKSTSKQTSAGGSRPKVPDRVYPLDYQQVPEATEVVEGIDWLARYNAQLNCRTKIVELGIPGQATVKLDIRGKLASSALISGIRVRKLLSKGAQDYLVFRINTSCDKVNLEDMPVVKDFSDVFPEELESLPLERDIVFKIDVTPGVAPISKAPNRMAPAELKELKMQLQDLDPRFVSRFWQKMQEVLGAKLNFSTTYHPQTDGQSERTIQTLEDMLRTCVLDFGEIWSERKILDPTIISWIEEANEKVKLVCQTIQTIQSHQKSYADNRRKDLEFTVGNLVFLKITPLKVSLMSGRGKKLQPRFVGPYKIIQRVGNVAYKLELPPSLSRIHNVFHVSTLKKYHPDPSHILQSESIEIDEIFTYEEKPVKLLDRKVKELRNKQIPLVKVLCRNHGLEEAT